MQGVVGAGRYCGREVRVQSAATAVGRANRQPRGAVPHPRRHRHRDGRVRGRMRGHHAHPRVGVRLPTPDRSTGRPRRWRRPFRPGALRPRSSGRSTGSRRPATSKSGGGSARTSWPRAGQLAVDGGLISYKTDSSQHASMGTPQSRGESRGQGSHVQLGVGGRLRRRRE